MDFSFGQNALGVTAAVTNRRFSIHTSLIPCSSPNKAPTGCLQWFTGTSGVGLVTTFNYAGGEHLADQVQTICFRYIQLVIEKIYSNIYDYVSFLGGNKATAEFAFQLLQQM